MSPWHCVYLKTANALPGLGFDLRVLPTQAFLGKQQQGRHCQRLQYCLKLSC